ncbi:uroporphyrinogen decarboxylase [Hydrogenoanaerobacterium saccharovorans]|uniref:Uroporphyrinogen decarboxylase n=1 Tax=Hydrogenoanaerobacterium saccharovorans TaxID=474960 RepID=A0A1H8E6B0_9FIRM|nr:uroporphyrinogen decarboxylase family protein [Hydrogenoanaerobacterium saccharovorans]RPF41971.1 uroporphyrinogen decarboxylase [Hydrogenoanaerobacterium saccharovorans]SEN15111.1 uroporphyrinogen decarboxylase [Hydrogenoanaerobacterium saccharovorans]
MTSRERIMASVQHKQPDRVPLDLGATPSSGISAIAYNNLKKHLDMNNGHTRIYDVVQQVVYPEQEILDLFGVDVIDVGRVFNEKDSDWYDTTLADGSIAQYPKWFRPTLQPNGSYLVFDKEGTQIAKMPVGATFFDQTYFPYEDDYPDNYDNLDKDMNKILWQALVHSPWDHASEPNFYEDLRKRVLQLRQNTDKALMITCGCNLFEWGTFLRRIDNFLMDIYSDEDAVKELLEQLMVRHLATLEKVCDAVGDIVDILRFGDDLGMDTGMFMSREKYQTIFKPHHTALNEYVHKHSKMKTFLHSCGSIYPIIGDLIDAGYDILNPVQTTAYQMDPAVLKREFGKDITFWGGGCNTRTILNRATPQEVYDYTRRMIDIFMVDGGFVFNTEHNIMPDVPPSNIIAMYQAVKDADLL